ncbi:uncharacterized protein BX664DRAFT_208521 [Halteromyces radiatus]|uniref:uncharacterized protein n=1 Tax=Halteromyces radiatus TaxID=101107 RepID=UPI0022201DCD|nr:uncharacterized protein BX664DRAFT_208521 [Halteromyces radiatus]KAI8080084.1 hypothetical protein BX664DRAFT_208521 [Halteromyces radiatus]
MDSIIKKEMASIPYIPVELLSIHPTITDYATDRTLYFTHVVLPQQAQWMVKKFRGYNSARTLYNEISAPLYQWLQDPETAINQDLPYPRLYISKNRTYIKEAADHSSSSCFVLIWDVEITDAPSTLKRDDIFLLTTNVTLGYPFSESINMFNPPPISQPDASNDILPKAYVKFLPLKTHYKVKCLISKQMESTFLRRPHVTHRVIANQNINGTVDEFLTRQMVHSLWTGEHHLDLPEIYSISDTNTTTHKKEKSSISSTSSTSSPTTAKSYQASHLASNHSASHPASNHSASTTTTLFTPSDTKKEQISRTVNNQIPSLSSPTSSSDVKTLENLTTGMNGDRSQMITKTAVPSAEEEEQFENSLRIYRERCNTLFDDLKKCKWI